MSKQYPSQTQKLASLRRSMVREAVANELSGFILVPMGMKQIVADKIATAAIRALNRFERRESVRSCALHV